MSLEIEVNGENREVNSPPDTPLLWVLRDELHLTGTKYGCGIAQCGACTVHLNGRAIRSCQVAVGDVGASSITTIEAVNSLAANAVRQAWTELDVVQCGFCQSGQIMQAIGLLERDPQPTDELTDAVMGSVACRCATYVRIRSAIHRAAEILGDSQ
ncbi:MAG: (2Fe-2S)-binding protein [Rhizobiaceae bacterium]